MWIRVRMDWDMDEDLGERCRSASTWASRMRIRMLTTCFPSRFPHYRAHPYETPAYVVLKMEDFDGPDPAAGKAKTEQKEENKSQKVGNQSQKAEVVEP